MFKTIHSLKSWIAIMSLLLPESLRFEETVRLQFPVWDIAIQTEPARLAQRPGPWKWTHFILFFLTAIIAVCLAFVSTKLASLKPDSAYHRKPIRSQGFVVVRGPGRISGRSITEEPPALAWGRPTVFKASWTRWTVLAIQSHYIIKSCSWRNLNAECLITLLNFSLQILSFYVVVNGQGSCC